MFGFGAHRKPSEPDTAFFHLYLGLEDEWRKQPAALTEAFPTLRATELSAHTTPDATDHAQSCCPPPTHG